MIVFDATTYGPDEVPVPNSEMQGMMMTHDVLIDLNGDRELFRTGWYDHDNDEWMLNDVDAKHLIHPEHMRWSFLPLAIYDTNPELRKTVKL